MNFDLFGWQLFTLFLKLFALTFGVILLARSLWAAVKGRDL